MLGEKRNIFLVQKMGEGIGLGFQIVQPAILRFGEPPVVVAVAVEDDAFVLGDDPFDEVVQGKLEIFCGFKLVGKLFQNLRHRRVDGGVGVGNGRGRAEHTEFELIARKRKGRGTVSVRRVLGEFGQSMYADTEEFLLLIVVGYVLFNRFENLGEFVA